MVSEVSDVNARQQAVSGQDVLWMRLALREAEAAHERDEVPVGAVLVLDDVAVGRGHNLVETMRDATAHAEMMAMHEAASLVGNQRLNEATMYVTLEPCAMCLGAMILARVGRLVYGAPDPKFGACGSVVNLLDEQHRWNHVIDVTPGVLADESAALMKRFFERLRSGERPRSAQTGAKGVSAEPD